MNIFAHGLWGIALSPQNNQKWQKKALVYSVLPDLTWLPLIGLSLLFSNNPYIPFEWIDAPQWFITIYSLSHSIVIWIAFFSLISLIRRQFEPTQFYWLLHILFDIPGHTHLTTPFLYPISSFQYQGTFNWQDNPFAMISIIAPLIIIFLRSTIKQAISKKQ